MLMPKNILKIFLIIFLIAEIAAFLFFFFGQMHFNFQLLKQEIDNDRQALLKHLAWVVKIKEAQKKNIFDPTTLTWYEATSSANWYKRDAHVGIAFNNKLWVMGGVADGPKSLAYEFHDHTSDIWSSSDGISWTLETDKAAWGKRRAHAITELNGKLWLAGGWVKDDWKFHNDVWSSVDGINWVEVASTTPWSARKGHSLVAFDNKLWLIGGVDNVGAKNDVWSSTDGITWELVTDKAPWLARYDQTIAVFNGKMWLHGGVNPGFMGRKDIWSSVDGKEWVLEKEIADYPGRHGHCILVYHDKLFILAGWSGYAHGYNDVWYSDDGVNFTQLFADGNNSFVGREDPVCMVYNDKIWIMGGMVTSGRRVNDVWYLE